MTTRSGQHLKQHSNRTHMEAAATTATDLTALTELIRNMMQDREQQIAEEKRPYEEDTERQIQDIARQLEILQDSWEWTRLSENDDIEAYLTTFD